jgi:hypothetical protein
MLAAHAAKPKTSRIRVLKEDAAGTAGKKVNAETGG